MPTQDMTGLDRTGNDSTGEARTGHNMPGQGRTGQNRTEHAMTWDQSTAQDRAGQHCMGWCKAFVLVVLLMLDYLSCHLLP